MATTLEHASAIAPSQRRPAVALAAPRFDRLRESLHTAAPPVGVLVAFVLLWQAACTALNIPHYLLPKPTDVVQAGSEKLDVLGTALISTFTSALIGLSLAVLIGMSTALVMAQSK